MGNSIKSHLPDLNMIQRKSETGYMLHLGNISSLLKRTNAIWAYWECSFRRKKRQFRCLWINLLPFLDSTLYLTAHGGPNGWVQRCARFSYLCKELSIVESKTKVGYVVKWNCCCPYSVSWCNSCKWLRGAIEGNRVSTMFLFDQQLLTKEGCWTSERRECRVHRGSPLRTRTR